ncbi:MAG: sulfur globule protein CV1, partial [Chromatiaceae bacterium]
MKKLATAAAIAALLGVSATASAWWGGGPWGGGPGYGSGGNDWW